MSKYNKQVNFTVLAFGDTHEPYSHKDYIKFLTIVKKKYKPDEVVHLGDEADKHAMSFHDSDPELFSAGDELKETIKRLKPLYKLFPNVKVCNSNHGSMHYRKGKHHGIPRAYLRSYNEILEAPVGWVWKDNWIINSPLAGQENNSIYCTHGLQANSLKLALSLGMNVLQGHYHSSFGVEYSSSPEKLIWGASAGCLVDKESLALAYSKVIPKRPILGCVVVVNNVPIPIPMLLDKNNNWVGKL